MNKEHIVELIVNQRLSFVQASKILGVCRKSLSRFCKQYEIKPILDSKCLDLSNRKFGNLLVIETDDDKKSTDGSVFWKCQCDCGNIHSVRATLLNTGKTQWCLFCKAANNRISKNIISQRYLSIVKTNALCRGLSFDINTQDVYDKYAEQERKCCLSGLPIEFKFSEIVGPQTQTASIDRIDSDLGYTKDNIQIIHKLYQDMKWTMSNKEFRYFCKMIHYPDLVSIGETEIQKRHGGWKGYGNIGRKQFNVIYKRRDNSDLDIEFLWNLFLLQNGKCAISGIGLRFPHFHNESVNNGASLDRIDSNLGYFKSNVHWVHKNINQIKFDLTMEDFLKYTGLVVQNTATLPS